MDTWYEHSTRRRIAADQCRRPESAWTRGPYMGRRMDFCALQANNLGLPHCGGHSLRYRPGPDFSQQHNADTSVQGEQKFSVSTSRRAWARYEHQHPAQLHHLLSRHPDGLRDGVPGPDVPAQDLGSLGSVAGTTSGGKHQRSLHMQRWMPNPGGLRERFILRLPLRMRRRGILDL